jgi:hypothetical protein
VDSVISHFSCRIVDLSRQTDSLTLWTIRVIETYLRDPGLDASWLFMSPSFPISFRRLSHTVAPHRTPVNCPGRVPVRYSHQCLLGVLRRVPTRGNSAANSERPRHAPAGRPKPDTGAHNAPFAAAGARRHARGGGLGAAGGAYGTW